MIVHTKAHESSGIRDRRPAQRCVRSLPRQSRQDIVARPFDVGAHQAACEFCIVVQRRFDDPRVLVGNGPVERIALQEQSTITIVQVVQRGAELQQQRHPAGRDQLLVQLAMGRLPFLQTGRRGSPLCNFIRR